MRLVINVAEADVKDIEKYMDENDLTYTEIFAALALMVEQDELENWL